MPSLVQLDEAVREFLTENPDDMVTVVVDASFGHRIDASELKMFEEAEEAGELVSPPAGAIGRGDAFLLRIADKTGATVLSNDSFQEFHGDYDWLFERGRLIGGKPVPAVGWIFTPRTPVRGPRSREAVKEAKRSKGDGESTTPGLDLAAERSKGTKGRGRKTVERAIAVALEEAVAPKEKARRPRKGATAPAEPVNDPLTFITFIAAHPLGGEVSATVESFASHGAFVECEGARCYVPLSAMGEPPPKSAREVFSKGELVTFVVQALDPQRRGVELAMPGFAKIAGAPTEETVAAEIEARASEESEAGRRLGGRRRTGSTGQADQKEGGAGGGRRGAGTGASSGSRQARRPGAGQKGGIGHRGGAAVAAGRTRGGARGRQGSVPEAADQGGAAPCPRAGGTGRSRSRGGGAPEAGLCRQGREADGGEGFKGRVGGAGLARQKDVLPEGGGGTECARSTAGSRRTCGPRTRGAGAPQRSSGEGSQAKYVHLGRGPGRAGRPGRADRVCRADIPCGAGPD